MASVGKMAKNGVQLLAIVCLYIEVDCVFFLPLTKIIKTMMVMTNRSQSFCIRKP